MLLLALDTSSRSASTALFDGEQIVHSGRVDPSGRSASLLAKHLKTVYAHINRNILDTTSIALPTGPGSFTGLRVGVVTAKSLAYAIGCPVVGVNTLDVIANHVMTETSDNEFSVILDAQRQEFFVAKYQRESFLQHPTAVEIIRRDQLPEFCEGKPLYGPGWDRIPDELATRLHAPVEKFKQCSAEWVANLVNRTDHSETNDCWNIKPNYFRLSAAEEKKSS